MRESCLEQIRYWSRACKDMQKGIDRKNKRINSLQKINSKLKQEVFELRAELAATDLERANRMKWYALRSADGSLTENKAI